MAGILIALLLLAVVGTLARLVYVTRTINREWRPQLKTMTEERNLYKDALAIAIEQRDAVESERSNLIAAFVDLMNERDQLLADAVPIPCTGSNLYRDFAKEHDFIGVKREDDFIGATSRDCQAVEGSVR